ncbi:MAG: hypothetical protein AAB285_01425, partial [candidate division NC10 bacterium]
PVTVNLLPGQDVLTVFSMRAKIEALLRGLGVGFLPEPMVRAQVEAMRAGTFAAGTDLTRYFELLPPGPLRTQYLEMRATVDPERRAETRAALAQALDHVIRDGASRIDQLLDGGELEPAAREGEWLRAVAEEGRQLGLREEDLAASLAVARPIMARLDRARSGTSP